MKTKLTPLIYLILLSIFSPIHAETATDLPKLNAELFDKCHVENVNIINADTASSFINPYTPIFELFEQTQILGTGTYSTVYKCTDTKNYTYAIKKYALTPEMRTLLKEHDITPENFLLHIALNELEIGLQLNHPNIVKLHNLTFKENDGQLEAYILMDYVPGETFNSQTGYSQSLQKKIIYQFLDANDYLFSSNIIPDDLWSDNFIVSEECEKLTLIDIGGYEFAGQNDAPFGHYYEELLYTINSMTLELDNPKFHRCMEKWKNEVFQSIEPGAPFDSHHIQLLHQWVCELKEVLGAQ